eukprot:750296-Pleurochrysis_carterae.AAC.1
MTGLTACKTLCACALTRCALLCERGRPSQRSAGCDRRSREAAEEKKDKAQSKVLRALPASRAPRTCAALPWRAAPPQPRGAPVHAAGANARAPSKKAGSDSGLFDESQQGSAASESPREWKESQAQIRWQKGLAPPAAAAPPALSAPRVPALLAQSPAAVSPRGLSPVTKLAERNSSRRLKKRRSNCESRPTNTRTRVCQISLRSRDGLGSRQIASTKEVGTGWICREAEALESTATGRVRAIHSARPSSPTAARLRTLRAWERESRPADNPESAKPFSCAALRGS